MVFNLSRLIGSNVFYLKIHYSISPRTVFKKYNYMINLNGKVIMLILIKWYRLIYFKINLVINILEKWLTVKLGRELLKCCY
jgi:hypothetical protein